MDILGAVIGLASVAAIIVLFIYADDLSNGNIH